MKQITTTLILLCSFGCPLFAQHDDEGHSDVEFSYVSDSIEIEPGAEGFVFEGEFGEGLLAPNEAEDPGFASEMAEGLGINPEDVIGFNLLDNLYYWDGTAFESPGATVLTVQGKGGAADTPVDGSSGVQMADFTIPTNLVGQADGAGDFHTHLDFLLSDVAEVGAYGMVMSLSSDDAAIADSGRFGVFLNFGLDEASFEAGAEAFGAVVPEPSSLMLVGLSLLGIGCLRRKR